MISKTYDTPAIRAVTIEKGEFLGEYASWLWACGATCIRIQKNLSRMAEAIGVEADVTIMPRHIDVSVTHKGCDALHTVILRKIPKCGINFSMNTRLSRLSWEVADKKLSYEKAVSQFREIISSPPTPGVEILFLTGLANASFCRLFGGDMIAMLVVFVATLAGYRLKQMMLSKGLDVRLVFMCCAFFSSSISAGAQLFQWGDTPEIALATSVLYLIPGVPYINSVSDLIDCRYLCAFSRFMDAAVLTVSLSIGLCAGLFVLGLNCL